MSRSSVTYYAAHNGVAAVYDERGDAVLFSTAAEASQHGEAVTLRPLNIYTAQRFSQPPHIVARLHGRVIYSNGCETIGNRSASAPFSPRGLET